MPSPQYEYVAVGHSFNLTQLLDHIRQDADVPEEIVHDTPHPLFVTLVTVGGVFFALSCWGLVAVAVIALLLR